MGIFYCLILSGTEGIWILLRKGEQSIWVREDGGRREEGYIGVGNASKEHSMYIGGQILANGEAT
jgi:hypothetical protein